jgi:hypothetical protein
MTKKADYKISRQDITDNMLDGPVNPYKLYGKGTSGRKTAKKPVRRSPAAKKGGK